jgi:hypothetical protein
MEELQQHQGEWFFLHELNVDKVFSTIQRADYLILYYIKVEQEAHPGEKLYLADLAAAHQNDLHRITLSLLLRRLGAIE